jgi:hypothetical protein
MSAHLHRQYAALSGALWGDVATADNYLHLVKLALDLGQMAKAHEYLAKAQAITLRGLGRSVLQFEPTAPAVNVAQAA